MIANVIVDVPANPINQTFDYLIPPDFEPVLEKGMRVTVPFGPRKVMGFVVAITDRSDHTKLKEISDVLDVVPALTDELITLGRWLADKTLSFYITTYQAMLPQVLKTAYDKEYAVTGDVPLSEKLADLFAGRDVISDDQFRQSDVSHHELQQAVKEGQLRVHYLVRSRVTKKYTTMLSPAIPPHQLEEAILDLPKAAKKQQDVLHFFADHPQPTEEKYVLEHLHITRSPVDGLIAKNLLLRNKVEAYRNPYDDDSIQPTSPLALTEEQHDVITPIKQTIEQHDHRVFLMHGVTGSGKTEIYLQAIQDVLERGKEAIVLVPEISLTPQMVRRFKGRFGASVAVMHSALSAGEKYDEWRKIQQKQVQVVVGARSAIFAPFENLGIIIMDEEHETSYKQGENPRYHARDVAIRRGENHACPVVLGSATPTLESYARAKKGVYQLGKLHKRTNEKAMPDVEIIDMRSELHTGNRSMFSGRLKEAIETCMAKGEQVVLLLNRRGYSTFVMCRDCGHVKECPHCDIALTYHKSYHKLKCHYCSYEEPMPMYCPECDSDLIRYFGTGTQRVEEALKESIPTAGILRMDVDTTRKKGSHESILRKFADGEADILLGTQMIAKGLDFENVTLVGVLTADSMLHLPDFRSSEKTFQLITQVSGRAGRHELPGKVVVQAYTPEHYSIQMASIYDYEAFFHREMGIRKKFQYPPYVFLALITITHPNQVKVIQATRQFVQQLNEHTAPDTVVLGPSPSPIARMKDRYRYQCMVKYKNETELQSVLQHILHSFEEDIGKDDLTIAIDMEPQQLM